MGLKSYLLLFLTFCLIPLYTEAVDCTGLPTDTVLSARLMGLIDSSGGEGGETLKQIEDGPFYTCQVQGSTMGTYQMLSVIVTYTITGSDTAVRVGQFELDCLEFNSLFSWEAVSNSLADTNVVDYVNIAVRTDCSSCTSTASNDHHCQACNSACNDGLMRCTGTGSNDCCAAFEDSNCISTPICSENNFVANEQNSFTCACGLDCTDGYTLNSTLCSCVLTDICVADNPCSNGVCVLVSSPDQYTCDCTGTNYMGTNCTECKDCPLGYSLMDDNNCSSCQATHICHIDNPCNSQGNCIIEEEGDNNYTCSCFNNFSSTNCTECSLVCENGYTYNEDCSSCVLTDICVADNPCTNGVCELVSSPDQYTCDCTGTDYMGTNCSECGLQCQNSGTPTTDCTECMCVTRYTGRLCDVEVDYCTDNDCVNGECQSNYSSNSYTCVCNEGWAGPACDQCTLGSCIECSASPLVCISCHGDYVVSSDGICVFTNPCASEMPCLNNGTCVNSRPGVYKCTCSEGWNGTDCTECATGYGMRGSLCVACSMDNCRNCSENYTSCSQCVNGYDFSDSRECIRERARGYLAGVGISVALGIILLLILIAIIVYVVYYFMDESAIASRKTKAAKANVFTEAHNNPMYLTPDEVYKA